jgi:hypothetical protein
MNSILSFRFDNQYDNDYKIRHLRASHAIFPFVTPCLLVMATAKYRVTAAQIDGYSRVFLNHERETALPACRSCFQRMAIYNGSIQFRLASVLRKGRLLKLFNDKYCTGIAYSWSNLELPNEILAF